MKAKLLISALLGIIVITNSCEKEEIYREPAATTQDTSNPPYYYSSNDELTTSVDNPTSGNNFVYDTHVSLYASTACLSCHRQNPELGKDEAFRLAPEVNGLVLPASE